MSATGEVYALLVGINDYKCEAVRKLQFAVADVLAFREFLRERMGIKPQNCTILSNPVPWKNDLLGELDAFSNHPMGSDDTFILYFAGHGFALDGASYLLTFESDPSSADLLEDTAIPLSRIARYLRRMRAGQQLLILDACRNEPSTHARGTASSCMDAVMARDIAAMTKERVDDNPQDTCGFVPEPL